MQVISIEAMQERPSSTATVFSEPQIQPLASELDSQLDSAVDRVPATEAVDRRKLTDPVNEPQRNEMRKLLPPAIPELPVARQVMLKRRPPAEITPDVKPVDQPRRQTPPRQVAPPPTAAAVPIEQIVGLEEDSSADLSQNRPPSYPREAVRRKLEGVVLLELKITENGEVRGVRVIESSGHQILDDAAVNAVATWRGQPAKKWGRRVESIERLPIRFRL